MTQITKQVTSTNDFHHVLKEALNHDNVFVIFISTKNDDGKFWCPDCQTSDPIFKKAFDQLPSYYLVECLIPREGYKGNPDHPYRKDAEIQLKCIPTLMSWKKTGPGSKLGEEECADYDKVLSYLKQQSN